MNTEDDLQSSDDQFEQDDQFDNTEDQDHDGGGLDSDLASEPEHEQKTDDDANSEVNQESVNAAINKQHAKYREEQRKRLALEKRLAELEQGSMASEPEPVIPDVDYYDDDVEGQQRKRDEAIRQHQQWQYKQQQLSQQQQSEQQRRMSEQQADAAQKAEKFFKTAKELKIDQKTLNSAIQTVGQYELGTEVASYIMGDDKGVLITTALAKNPALLADLATMRPHEAILNIERNVRSKLKATRTSNANRPPTRVSGKASAESDNFPLTGGKVTVE